MSSLVETGKSITDTKFGWTLEVMIVLKQFQNIFSSESDSATKMSSTAAGVRRRGLAAEQGSRQQRQARQEVEDDCYRRPATRISGGAGHPAAGVGRGRRGPLTVEGAIVIRGGSQPLVEHNPDVHLRKDIRMCKALSAVVATDFLIGDEGEVDGADRLESRSLEAANRFQVLEADAFHVLGAPGVDVTCGAIDLGAKRRVRPLVRLGRDDVGVGIEEDSGEGGVLARPLEDNHRLPLHEFYNLCFQG
nr:hypothetical protein C4D60_Mb03t03480 [Ipomoea batatas]